MKKQVLKMVVGFGLLMIGLVVLVSCVSGELSAVEATPIGAITAEARPKADAASLARWQGLGHRYTSLTLAARERAEKVETARWEAIGAYFAEVAREQLIRSQAANIARWEEMGAHYSKPNADVARWIGLSERYQLLTQIGREMSADSARWIAMGEFYQEAGLFGDGQ